MTGTVFAGLLLALFLFDRAATRLADDLLRPWFALCKAITPAAWQTQGNILLGLVWIVSGILVCSMLIGAAGVTLLAIVARLRKSKGQPHAGG